MSSWGAVLSVFGDCAPYTVLRAKVPSRHLIDIWVSSYDLCHRQVISLDEQMGLESLW